MAEIRVAKAEGQVKQLQTQQAVEIHKIRTIQDNTPINGQSATESEEGNATPSNLPLSGYGNLKIYGDVELNMDAESNHSLLVMTNADVNSNPTNKRWNLSDHILLGFDDMRKPDNGYFVGLSAQPLRNMRGSVNISDAIFFSDKEGDWEVKVGRFEVYDMLSLDQNTFIKHSGDAASDLYDDGSGCIYTMKESRGRSNAGSSFLVSKQFNNWYLELSTLPENGASLYNDGNYHERDTRQQKNVAYLRPVTTWSPTEEFTISVAMEANVVNNVYDYTGSKGNLVDQSNRIDYGMSIAQGGLKTDLENGIVVNLNTAYLDVNSEKDSTAGVNTLQKRFKLGYIYAHNEIDKLSGVVCDNNYQVDDEGTHSIHTIRTSYQLANTMDIENFNIYLDMHCFVLDNDDDKIHGNNSDDRYGTHVRFKYFF